MSTQSAPRALPTTGRARTAGHQRRADPAAAPAGVGPAAVQRAGALGEPDPGADPAEHRAGPGPGVAGARAGRSPSCSTAGSSSGRTTSSSCSPCSRSSSLVASLHNEFVFGSVYRGLTAPRLRGLPVAADPVVGPSRHGAAAGPPRLPVGGPRHGRGREPSSHPARRSSFEGRLSGALWPMPPPQVAHYAAVLFGTSVILWMCRVITGRHALARRRREHRRPRRHAHPHRLLGAVIGLAIAVGQPVPRSRPGAPRVGLDPARPRGGGLVFAPQIVTWLARGQSAEDAAQLTGRTKVWSDVFAHAPAHAGAVLRLGAVQQVLRRPGRSTATGWRPTSTRAGSASCVAGGHPRPAPARWRSPTCAGPRRAVALFLIVYCMVASVTETGLGDASPYLLDLVVAASLLVSRRSGWRREGPGRPRAVPLDRAERGEPRRRPGAGGADRSRPRRRARSSGTATTSPAGRWHRKAALPAAQHP